MKPLSSISIVKNHQKRGQKGQALSVFGLAIASFVSIIAMTIGMSPISMPGHSPDAAVLLATQPPALVFKSVAANDGWVLESSESSSVGGSVNAILGTIRLGDDALNRQYRGILSFDTSSVPDGAIISSVVLKIRQDVPPVGRNPFNTQGNLWVDIQKGPFGAIALQAADFNTLASREKVASFDKIPVDGWLTAIVGPGGRMLINKTGLTQLRLYFGVDDNNNHLADYLTFYSGDAASAANRPVLEIRYYYATPTSTITRTPTVSPTKTGTLISPVTGSVALQNVGAAYGATGHITATFSAQSTDAQVTQMRMVASWSNPCDDPTNYAWETFVTNKAYNYTNWNSDSYFSVAVQYKDALGNLSPVYCDTALIPGASTPTPFNTPTLIPTLSGSAPDLTVASISVVYQPGTFAGSCRLADAPVAVRAVIENTGNLDAGAFSVLFNGSTYSFAGLAAGQTLNITSSFGTFIPYSKTATVDTTNVVVEGDENNNTLTVTPVIAPRCTATPVPTADPALPDLVVSSITSALDPSIHAVNGCYPSVLIYGTSVTISNIGGVDAGAFSVALNIGGVDYSQSVAGLAVGQSLSIWFNVPLSRPATAMVDSTNAVVESNENNTISIYVSSGTSTPTGTRPATQTPCKTTTLTPNNFTLTPTRTLTLTPTITMTPTHFCKKLPSGMCG